MTKETWDMLSSRIGVIFNFGIEKKEWLKNCAMARFIAAVPFLAQCDKTIQTALSHLAIYILSIDESAREVFFHKPEDDGDIYSRLSPISGFKGGDNSIIQCCMDLIALTMLSNYKKDAAKDLAMGKYNPLNEGKWDYSEKSERLIESIKNSITPEIEGFYTLDEAFRGFWRE